MALITNAQVKSWANLRARTICDSIRHLDDLLASYVSDYVGQGIAAAINGDAAGAASVIDDGSAVGGTGTPDGRNPITGTNLANLKACIDQVRVAIETTAVAGVGSPPLTTVNAIQVNGSSK